MSDELEHLVGGPFDVVFDIGGNIGEWSEDAYRRWPEARIYSFEPISELAVQNAKRADGRWQTYTLGISDSRTVKQINICTNQHSASTMQVPGSARRKLFGISDTFKQRAVSVAPLDDLLEYVEPFDEVLVKIDVEGHEGAVIRGGQGLLELAAVVVCEVNVNADVFYGSAALSASQVDVELQALGLALVGSAGELYAPSGELVQLDGVWRRELDGRERFPRLENLLEQLQKNMLSAGDSSAADAV